MNDSRPPGGSTAQPNVLFTHEVSAGRRRFPIIYVQFGALGDLCLSRINGEIFDYTDSESEHPFQEVWFCDVASARDWRSLAEHLYDKTVNYRCVDRYFSPAFLAELDKTAMSVGQVLREDRYRDSAASEWKEEKSCFTRLGHFVVTNYKQSATRDQVDALFARQPTDYDWVFYLAVSPHAYREIAGWITDYFEKAEGELMNAIPEDARTRKLMLFEKPFQHSAKEAQELEGWLRRRSKDLPTFSFFAVEHYAAKWTLSQLPEFVKNHPPFQQFVNEADEIIIELLEAEPTPDFRLDYMGTAGLFLDMMPHALVPVQFLYGGKDVTIDFANSELLAAGIYDDPSVRRSRKPEAADDGSSKSSSYALEIDNWLEGLAAEQPPEVRYETYFSILLTLEVRDAPEDEDARRVRVYIRSGKGMNVNRKRVIIKQSAHSPDGPQVDVPNVEIDIGNEEIKTHQHVTFPRYVTSRVKNAQIKGYAWILVHVTQRLRDFRSSSGVLELLRPENALRIIENIETIDQKLRVPHDPARLTRYPAGEKFILSDKEEVFQIPFKRNGGDDG